MVGSMLHTLCIYLQVTHIRASRRTTTRTTMLRQFISIIRNSAQTKLTMMMHRRRTTLQLKQLRHLPLTMPTCRTTSHNSHPGTSNRVIIQHQHRITAERNQLQLITKHSHTQLSKSTNSG